MLGVTCESIVPVIRIDGDPEAKPGVRFPLDCDY